MEKQNEIMKFQFNESEINTITIDGIPYFVAKNVCDVLGLNNTSMALQSLENDEKLISKLLMSGQNREVSLISESGLYRLVMRSNKPEAKTFQKWVTSEVLPTIRKTGQYSKNNILKIDFNEFEIITKGYGLAIKRFEMAEKKLEIAETKIKEDAPKVELYDRAMATDTTFDITSAAKLLGLKPNNLFKELRARGILYYRDGNNIPNQEYLDRNYFDPKETVIKIGDKEVVRIQPRLTQKGFNWLSKLFPDSPGNQQLRLTI